MASKSSQLYGRMKADQRQGREHFRRVDAVHKEIAGLEAHAASVTRNGITMGAAEELNEVARELAKHEKKLAVLEGEEGPLYVRKYSKPVAYTAANRARNEAAARATNEFSAYRARALEQLTAAKKSSLPHEVMFLAQKLQAANRLNRAKRADAAPVPAAAAAAAAVAVPAEAKVPNAPRRESAANAAPSWRGTKKANSPKKANASAANAANSWRGTRKSLPNKANKANGPSRMPRDLDHLIHEYPVVYEHVSGPTFRIKFHNKNLRDLARKEGKREGEVARHVKERIVKAFQDTKKVTVREVGEICEIDLL